MANKLLSLRVARYTTIDKWIDVEPYGIRVDFDDVDHKEQKQVVKQLVTSFNAREQADKVVDWAVQYLRSGRTRTTEEDAVYQSAVRYQEIANGQK